MLSKKNSVPIIVVIFLIVAVGVLVTRRGEGTENLGRDKSNTQSTPSLVEERVQPPAAAPVQPVPTPTPPAATDPAPVAGRFSGEADMEGNDVQVFEVVYDGTAFIPSVLTVKQGDVVVFKNKSKVNFQPAFDPSSNEAAYPEFNAQQLVGPTKSYQFKFTKVGTWQYFDYAHQSVKARITVTP